MGQKASVSCLKPELVTNQMTSHDFVSSTLLSEIEYFHFMVWYFIFTQQQLWVMQTRVKSFWRWIQRWSSLTADSFVISKPDYLMIILCKSYQYMREHAFPDKAKSNVESVVSNKFGHSSVLTSSSSYTPLEVVLKQWDELSVDLGIAAVVHSTFALNREKCLFAFRHISLSLSIIVDSS